MPEQPVFEGLVVLELASVLAGPSVGQFFAELGATVLKVENTRTRGDVTRRWGLPDEASGDASSYFACCNWGKQSVALHLGRPEGRALLHGLARHSDVVLASYRPGASERLGADAATLRACNPRLIYGQITGYGPDDPRAGYDAVIQAESGFTFMNGVPDGPPTKMPVALMDVLAAHQLKEGLLLALLRRERTGQGGVVAVSLLQAAVSALANQATNWLVGGVVPQRTGSEHPNIAPYGTVFATADGHDLVLAVGTDRQFTRLCAVLGDDALVRDPRFATNTDRVRHRRALNTVLAPLVRAHRLEDLLGRLAEAGVPAGAVHAMPDVFAQPQAAALVLEAATEQVRGLRQVAFNAGAAPTLLPPPAYAAHTAEVLRRRLGCSTDEIERLAEAGVIDRSAPTP